MLVSRFDSFRARVRWGDTHFFWGDERHVPPDHPDSNFRMASEAMLSRVDIPPANVHRIRTETGDAAVVAAGYEETLCDFFECGSGELPRFDLVLLGMGADGHTASLFPDAVWITAKSALVAACRAAKVRNDRITLTPPVLNNAASVVFLVSGGDKAETVRAVLGGDYQPDRYPSQMIRPANGKLLWLLDCAAGSLLKPA
jgi:6-phosphogluconolactonase